MNIININFNITMFVIVNNKINKNATFIIINKIS